MKPKFKYSFMSFSCKDLTFTEMVSVAQACGYKGLEPRISEKHRHGLELSSTSAERKEIRKIADDSGIRIACIATSCRYADPATSEGHIQDTLRAIELAAEAGCTRLRVFGGALPAGGTHAEAIPRVVEALGRCSQAAASHGVTVCMETHDAWTDPAHVAEVMRQVNHPFIAVNWDFAHPVWASGVSVEESFQQLVPWIRHVHMHDFIYHTAEGRFELKPIGEGQFDHKAAVRLLKSISYDGFISGEWIDFEPYEIHLPREIHKMKQYEQEHDMNELLKFFDK